MLYLFLCVAVVSLLCLFKFLILLCLVVLGLDSLLPFAFAFCWCAATRFVATCCPYCFCCYLSLNLYFDVVAAVFAFNLQLNHVKFWICILFVRDLHYICWLLAISFTTSRFLWKLCVLWRLVLLLSWLSLQTRIVNESFFVFF